MPPSDHRLPLPGDPFAERKYTISGNVAEYRCTLALYRPPLVIVRYVLPGNARQFDTPVPIPPGSVSLGYFWTDRPYNAYRMRDPGGALLAHRFDAVTDVILEADAVSYRDLVLDWWLIPGRPLLEEDADELQAALASGLLSRTDAAAAAKASHVLNAGLDAVIAELGTLEDQLQ